MEQVNHPRHYNTRKDNLECIDIIRHYTFDVGCAVKYLWRAGQKEDIGRPMREKEIEDLEKALWYIGDELYFGIDRDGFAGMVREEEGDLEDMLYGLTDKTFDDIASKKYYEEHVANAMFYLLHVGLVNDRYVYRTKDAVPKLRAAMGEIQERIEDLKKAMGK